jgi:hypothetical protein
MYTLQSVDGVLQTDVSQEARLILFFNEGEGKLKITCSKQRACTVATMIVLT